jgi:peptidoglycan-N-acetylglucosamine deacetylase
MNPNPYITTSWDDGHPLDFRIAGMLARHGLRGTFYIPREASTGVMPQADVRRLSESFEIGAHTMRHVFLDTASDAMARREIGDSRTWVEQVTGKSCPMFCPPGGKFNAAHLALVKEAGFTALRSVELLSLERPRQRNGLLLMPTTLQAHPHTLAAYARNIARRHAWRNLWLYVLHGRTTQWERLTRSLLEVVRQRGGVFHLWGHSWELQEAGQWARLEEVLRFLGEMSREIPCLSNGELCDVFRIAA